MSAHISGSRRGAAASGDDAGGGGTDRWVCHHHVYRRCSRASISWPIRIH